MKPPLLSQIILPGSCSIGSTEMEQHKTERNENVGGAATMVVILQHYEAPPSSGRACLTATTKQTEGWLLRRCLLSINIAGGEKTVVLHGKRDEHLRNSGYEHRRSCVPVGSTPSQRSRYLYRWNFDFMMLTTLQMAEVLPTTNSFKYQRSLYSLQRDDVVMIPFSVKDTIVKMLFQRWVG